MFSRLCYNEQDLFLLTHKINVIFLWKDPDAGKYWRQEEKGTTEDEMVGWHHRLNGREFEQTLGDGEGQGSLECCSPWGCKESDKTTTTNAMSTTLFLLNCYVSLPRGVDLKLEHTSEWQEGLIKAKNSGPYLYKLIFSRIWGGAIIINNNLHF